MASGGSRQVPKKLQESLMWFVIGYYLMHIGSILLLYKINKQKSAYGVSLDSQIALLIAALSRCIWFSDT